MSEKPEPVDFTAMQRLQAENLRLSGEVDHFTIMESIREACDRQGGSAFGLTPHIIPRVRVSRDALGNRSIGVVDEMDPTRILPAFTVDDLVSSMKAKPTFAPLFGGSGDPPAARVISLTAQELRDPARYQKLKAQIARGEIDGVTGPDGRWVLRK